MPSYIIVNRDSQVAIRKGPQRRGGIKYAGDQQENPSSLTLQTSGEFRDECLLPGEIAGVIKGNIASEELYKLSRKHFFKDYIVINAYRVGPRALELFEKGIPLTPNVNADPSMYLRR